MPRRKRSSQRRLQEYRRRRNPPEADLAFARMVAESTWGGVYSVQYAGPDKRDGGLLYRVRIYSPEGPHYWVRIAPDGEAFVWDPSRRRWTAPGPVSNPEVAAAAPASPIQIPAANPPRDPHKIGALTWKNGPRVAHVRKNPIGQLGWTVDLTLYTGPHSLTFPPPLHFRSRQAAVNAAREWVAQASGRGMHSDDYYRGLEEGMQDEGWDEDGSDE